MNEIKVVQCARIRYLVILLLLILEFLVLSVKIGYPCRNNCITPSSYVIVNISKF